jgi:hypothetical protein
MLSFGSKHIFLKTFCVHVIVFWPLQMEKEIKDLKSQRDLAQSRLQNLMRTVGDQSKHSVQLIM